MRNFLIKEVKNRLLSDPVLRKKFKKDIKFIKEDKVFFDQIYTGFYQEVREMPLLQFIELFGGENIFNVLDCFYNDLLPKAIEDLKRIQFVKSFLSSGAELYIVGGYIRDIFLGLNPKDIDFVTNIAPENICAIFDKADVKYDNVGKHFGVVMVKEKNDRYEIATFRKDLNCNGKGATDIQYGTFDDDWQRRDFTVNSLYLKINPEDYQKSELIDPSGKGIRDLLKKQFSFIGSPKERIIEDSIRVLRVYKMQKKGLKPTKDTLKAARKNMKYMCETANVQRITDMIESLARSQNV